MKKFMLRRLGVAHDLGSHKPSVQDCMEAVLEQSDTLVDDVLAGLKSAISPVRTKSMQVISNPVTKGVIEQLCSTQADTFKESFAIHLRAALYGGDIQRGVSQPLRFDDFQFLEEEQIDANIELALTQQEINMAVDDTLPPLNAMISGLLGWLTVQPHLNPLKPESFVYALRETLVELVPKDEMRTPLMTPAAGMLGVSMRQLYKEITEWLRSQGVEPVAPTLAQGGAGAAAKPAESSVTRTLLTLDKLRRLLSGELDPGPLNSNIKDFTHTVPASFIALEDMKLMEPMMKRLAERASQSAAAKGTIAAKTADPVAQREKSQSKKLGRELGGEVVRLMLENLTQDHRMLAGVRSNLKTLEPVLLALSQTDARFFSERQHPARQFMDKITSRSLAFTSEDQPGFAHFRKALENAVAVLVGSGGDTATFDRVLRKLEEGWSREEHEQPQRAEEAARGLLHAEQRNLLAQKLAEDFAERIKNKKVPEIVSVFLRGPWAQVVAESQLLCADGTADADGYLSLVDDLIWSVQLKLARRNRARLVSMVPGMLVKMRQGLGLISYPEEKIPVFFDELITFHELAFEGAKPTPVGETPAVPATGGEPAVSAVQTVGLPADEFWMAQEEASDSGFMHAAGEVMPEMEEDENPDPAAQLAWSAEQLHIGSWVDLALGGVWVRAQLTWASPHKSLFMFISSTGMAHSMSRRTMDRLRGLGLIRLVSDGRVVDHALDAVAQAALRNDLENAGGNS